MKMKKFKGLFLAAVVALGLGSCEVVSKTLDVPLDQLTTFTIPPIDSVGTFSLSETALEYNIDSVLEANGSSRGLVKGLILESVEVKALNADDTVHLGVFKDFNFEAKTSEGDFTSIGSVVDNADENKDVTVNGSDVDVLQFFDGDGVVRATATNRRPLAKELTVELKYNYKLSFGL